MVLVGECGVQWLDRFEGHPHGGHAKIATNFDYRPRDRRMNMHVLVSVHMVEPQAGRMKRLELRADLHRELTANPGQSKKSNAGAAHVRIEPAVPAHQTGDFGARKARMPIDEYQMQADPQIRQAAGPRHGVSRGGGADHQARGRQNAAPVRFLDSFVDGGIEPEIVCADDQAFQLAISRLRRNWKNSTPSRSRRRIISGLLSISATREAILPRRK
jgi:hypothetical protein